MPVYFSGQAISNAISSLTSSRAKASLLDFLIVKRTLKIKGEPTAIAQSEPAFIQALNELAECTPSSSAGVTASSEKPYLNPFSTDDSKLGYRAAKFKSNGTNSTIAGNSWNNVVDLSSDDPRKTSLKSGETGYIDSLSRLLLTRGENKPKPSLTDAAAWYFRRRELSPADFAESDVVAYRDWAIQKFKSELDLSNAEIDALFTNDLIGLTATDYSTEVADPSSYLPGATANSSQATSSSVERALSRRLVSALSSKRFVIFTGPSGTGKSRSALRLAEGLQQKHGASVSASVFQMVPVGPDWTTPKKLLGYPTPFGETRSRSDGSETTITYEATETLRLILRANHPDAVGVPHIILFDEMNLSHVERYFAPFLSLLEAANIVDEDESAPLLDRHSVALLSEVLNATSPDSAEAKSAAILADNSQPLRLPPNLFFIGTVNVDETTYMFSPKVLDRAHVIEVEAPTPSTYLANDAQPFEVGGVVSLDVASNLLQQAIDDIEEQTHEGPNPTEILTKAFAESPYQATTRDRIKEETIKALDGCHALLSPVGFPVGFRTCKEVFAYLAVWIRLCVLEEKSDAEVATEWEQTLDFALLQKVLPKLHGSRRALSDSLKATAAFLQGNHTASTPAAKYSFADGTTIEIAPTAALSLTGPDGLANSISKLKKMHAQLGAHGHTSFIL